MKRLIISVDCDDVLVPSTEYIVRAYNQRYGTDVRLETAHSHKTNDDQWGADKMETMRRIHEIQLTPEYASTAPFDEAVRSCRQLARWHKLHLITARADNLMSVTVDMLDQYFPGVFDRIEHLGIDGDKGEMCREIGAEVLVDDNKKHLIDARNHEVDGLIWFGDYPWQSAGASSDLDKIVRCLDWISVEKEVERFAGK